MKFKHFGRVLSISLSLAIILTLCNKCYLISANAATMQDNIKQMLEESDKIAEGLKEIGFNSEQAKDILSLTRHESDFYSGIQEDIDYLKQPLSEENKSLSKMSFKNQHNLITDFTLMSSGNNADGNPPANLSEQRDRIIHVYSDASTRFSDNADISSYMVYYYLSHYVDNPYYSVDSPNFQQIFAEDLTSSDINAYDTFIGLTRFSDYSNDIASFISDATLVYGTYHDIAERMTSANNIVTNTLNIIKDSIDITTNAREKITKKISESITDRYISTSNAADLIDAVNEDLQPLNLTETEYKYADYCLTGVLALLSATFPVVGYSIAVTLYYYDYYSYILDRAKLASLQYSFSGRLALRTEQAIYG